MKFLIGSRVLTTGDLSLDDASQEFSFFPTAEDGQSNDYHTILVYDLDAGQHNSFLHFLMVNVQLKANPNGEVILSYMPPMKENHSYLFESYNQDEKIRIEKIPDRSFFDAADFIDTYSLSRKESVRIKTRSFTEDEHHKHRGY